MWCTLATKIFPHCIAHSCLPFVIDCFYTCAECILLQLASWLKWVRIHSISFSNALDRYVALRNNLFMSVVQHTDCSLQTLLFGDPQLNHKQNCDIFDAVQHFITLSKCFDWSPYVVSYCTLPLHLQPSFPTFPGHTASKQNPWQERFV